jgi:hypothetical protein
MSKRKELQAHCDTLAGYLDGTTSTGLTAALVYIHMHFTLTMDMREEIAYFTKHPPLRYPNNRTPEFLALLRDILLCDEVIKALKADSNQLDKIKRVKEEKRDNNSLPATQPDPKPVLPTTTLPPGTQLIDASNLVKYGNSYHCRRCSGFVDGIHTANECSEIRADPKRRFFNQAKQLG